MLLPIRRIAPRMLWATLLLTGLVSCGRDQAPPDVLLITVDTLRPDHLGLYGYERSTSPAIDRWFSDSKAAVFERCYSTEASTSPSVLSLLTGLYPQEHRVRLLYQIIPDSLVILPQLVSDRYQTAAIVSNNVLTDEATGMASRFDYFDDFVDEVEPYRPIYERNAERTTDAAIQWLEEHRDESRPVFLWVHYIDPHGPYRAPEQWKRSFEHEGFRQVELRRIAGYQREPGVTDALDYVDAYDEEIAYADAQIDRLMDSFDRTRGVESSFVLFTSDHGESMLEHERWFTHGYHVYDEITRVPLMMRGPGVNPGRSKGLVSGIDVFPTLLGALGVDPASDLEGLDLRARPAISADRMIFTEATPSKGGQWKAAISGTTKWSIMVAGHRAKVGVRRIHDLSADPQERNPLPWSSSPGANALLRWKRSDPDPGGIPANAAKGVRLNAPKVDPRVNAEMQEKLRSLGYVN